MVVLAVSLALLGIVVAFQQMESLTGLLLMQAQGRAADLANEIKREFNRTLNQSFGDISIDFVLASPEPGLPVDWPTWLSGLYVADSSGFRSVVKPRSSSLKLEKLIAARVAARTATEGDDGSVTQPELLYDQLDKEPVVLVYRREGNLRTGRTLVGYVDLQRLKRDLVEARIGPSDGLEVANAGDIHKPWSQALYSATRFWVLIPSRGLLGELRRTVVVQTLTYLLLTFMALAALLGSVWFLSRITRRELALAELKANFVADVSHELKTPLAVIRLYGETLQSGRIAAEEKRQEYYATITREAERLTNLINTILDFARIESGRKEFTMRRTDVVEVVREGYESYIPELERHGFLHRLTYEADLPPVEADADAIRRVLINLLSNAVKYCDDEKRIDIEVTRDTRRGKRGVLISVHDRGIGISAEDRTHVFDGFYRATDRRVREKAGTGLGLSLVKQIVEAHGGSIDIESRLVKGTTVRVFLPAMPEAMRPDSVPSPVV